MSKSKCIHAYTQQGSNSYPGFVNLSHHESEKHPVMMVRTPGNFGTQIASVMVPVEELLRMADEIILTYRVPSGTDKETGA